MANPRQRIVRGYGLHEHLKEHKPSVVIAYDEDGGETKINVPDVRLKHVRVMTALREVAWVRCDLHDKKGGLLYRHHRNQDDRDRPATEIEDLAPTTRATAELQGYVQIVVKAQDQALARHERAIEQILEAQTRLLNTAITQLELQGRHHQQAMALAHALANDLVQFQLQQLGAGTVADDDEGKRPESDSAVKALMPMMLRQMLEPKHEPKPNAPTPKNGASKPEPKHEPKE